MLEDDDIRVDFLTDNSDFECLSEAWDVLVSQCNCSTVFMSHGLLAIWLHLFLDNARLNFVTAYRGKQLVVAIPAILFARRVRGLRVKVIGFPANSLASRMEFLLSDVHRVEGKRAIDVLLGRTSNWDICKFDNIPADSIGLRTMLRNLTDTKVAFRLTSGRRSPYLTIEGSYNEYLALRSSGMRYKLNRSKKRMQDHHKPRVEHYTRPDELKNNIEIAFRVSSRSWKREAGTTMTASDRSRQYFLQLIDSGAKGIIVVLSVLYLDDSPVALVFSVGDKRRLECIRTDFDTDFARFSPGFVLLNAVIEHCFKTGVQEYDFGGEQYDHKMRFTNDVRTHQTLWIYGRSIRGQIFRLLHKHVSRFIKAIRPTKMTQNGQGLTADIVQDQLPSRPAAPIRATSP